MNSVTDGNLLDIDENWSPPAGPRAAGERSWMIERSWQRSMACGLAQAAEPDSSPVSCEAARTGPGLLLQEHALPTMEALRMHLADTHGMVALADGDGVILHVLGDADFLARARRIALKTGVNWSEHSKGTNAIGAAIAEKEAVLVHADEHYLSANRFLSSCAAPIFDCGGNVAGVLSVSGDRCNFQEHTLALVRMSAQLIENQLFSTQTQDGITLHFGACAGAIGTLMGGIACFTPGGRFLAANRAGLRQLQIPPAGLQAHTFSSLFKLPLSALFEHHRDARPAPLELRLPNGERVWARAQVRLAHGMPLPAAAGRVPASIATPFAQPPADSGRMSCLRFLNTGDPQVAVVIGKIQRVIGCGIPILINGETGTGKELLAQAIHNDSPRAKGPFVAVNSASIPETLIESELFGYEDGAFTGARKKGSIGKIAQASGGTLFLDEIGDMPLNLQARLLRVLQTRQVTPLGSTRSISVDIELICATHRNLRELIARGEFREDLYYRLNGLVVKLPPVRERADLEFVIGKILKAESHDLPRTIAPDLMRLFKRHRWPGNFRQLQNLLRIAVVMAGDANEIRSEHLPEDFLDEPAEPAVETASAHRAPAPSLASVAGGTGLVEMELSAIRKALEAHDWNVSAAARALGISRNTIYRKLNLLKSMPA